MEDIISTILDVVRAQHTATEGTDQKPFDMDDIVDMAMNVVGRPDEPEDIQSMTDSIQKMVASMAPDLFPPKTFEQMDDEERAASVTSMLESRLINGFTPREKPVAEVAEEKEPPQASARQTSAQPAFAAQSAQTSGQPESQEAADPFASMDLALERAQYDSIMQSLKEQGVTADLDPNQTAELNDIIYKNLMDLMGATPPKVEYPFDRSQIRYGKEKTFTEQLEEEREEELRARENAQESSSGRAPRLSAADLAQSLIDQDDGPQISAWDIAQNAVNIDEELHKKEPYRPKPVEEPKTKSASQLAAEAIARAQEEDRMKLEIEKQAEVLMAEAKKRGQDPMKFALHQQEILRYMEKNTDELVSFEDYEDLSPEEKLEVERQIYIEKQIADGVDPDKVDTEVPEEYIPLELKAKPEPAQAAAPAENGANGASPAPPMSEEMLRMISREVVQENSEMILAENANEDLGQLQQTIFENLKSMMDKTGAPLPLEDVGDLIEQAIASNRESQIGSAAAAAESPAASPTAGSAASPVESPAATVENIETESVKEASAERKLSAVELAKAAQKEAKVEPKEERVTRSAADIAKEAQMKALAAKLDPASASKTSEGEGSGASADSVEGLGAGSGASADSGEGPETGSGASAGSGEGPETGTAASETGSVLSEAGSETDDAVETGAKPEAGDSLAAESQAEDAGGRADETLPEEDDDEYEYVDPDELVLGDHTQAEVDEALANLATLGLEGDVYERAKRMLLLELAGSEAELEAWLRDQENKRAKKPVVEDDSIEDLNDLDEDELERELEEALDGDFLEEDFLDDVEFEEDESEEESDAEAETGSEEDADVEAETGSEEESDAEAETDSEEDADAEEESDAEAETEYEEDVDAEAEDESAEESDLGSEDLEESDSGTEDESEDEEIASEESDEPEEFEYNEETEEADIEVSKEDNNIIDVKHLDEESEIIEVIKDSDEDEAEGAGAPKPADSAAKSGTGASYGGKGNHRKKLFRRRERSGAREDKDGKGRFAKGAGDKPAEEKSYQVSTRKPFILKNSASFMDQFEDFIVDTQENRKLSTGFKKLDGMLRYGLHKGSYFIDSRPQYLKNAFMQQIADRAAESGIDVLYISTELSRYDLMVETISRLSYEIHQGDPNSAVSAMAIMTGEEGADLSSLKDELNWYRGRISEHLFILDHEAVSEYAASSDAQTAGDVLTELISSIVREGAHKPVVFIDNIENILSTEDSEDMKPLMEGLSRLARELGIPILMSYGYTQAESEEEMYPEEREYHESIGNMCDVYLELEYADMIADDMIPLTADDIREMVEEGESLLINIHLHKNRRPMKASLQIQGTPKFNFFEE